MTEITEKDKRTAILEATLELISEHGFGTPMSKVAKCSNVSAGIIYHYFENKDDLINELYKHIKTEFKAILLKDDPDLLEFPEDVEQMWLNAFHYFVNHPKETMFMKQYDNSPYGHAWNEAHMNDNVNRLSLMIKRDVTEGKIREMPYEVFYELTLGVAVSLAMRKICRDVEFDEAMLRSTAKACARAVAAT